MIGIACDLSTTQVAAVAHHCGVDKDSLFVPIDASSATSAAQQWYGISFDTKRTAFKVYYQRAYGGMRYTLHDAVALMVSIVSQNEQRTCTKDELWALVPVAFAFGCRRERCTTMTASVTVRPARLAPKGN